MPLQRQVVSIPMSGGLNTKTDDKQLPIGQLLELENGFRKRNGELQKRYGFESLTRTIAPTGTIDEGRRLTVYNNELGVITNKSFYSYSDQGDAWNLKGPLETLSVDSQPIISNSYSLTTADSATANNIAVYAWEQSGTTNSIRYSIVDRTNNNIIVGDQILDSQSGTTTTYKPRCVAIRNKVFIFYYRNGNNFKCRIIDVELPFAAATHVTIGTGDMNPTGNADIVEYNGALLFVYQVSAGGFKVGYVSQAGVVGSGSNGLPAPQTFNGANQDPDLCITLFYENTTRFSIAWATTGGTAGVYHLGLYPDLTTVWLAEVQLEAYAGTATTRIKNITGFHRGNIVHTYYDKDDTTDKWKRSVTDQHLNITTNSVTAGAGNLKSVSLAGKIFYTDDNGFVPVAYYSGEQPTLFLLRNDGSVSAKMLTRRSAGETAKSGHLPNITLTDGNKWSFPAPYKTRLASENAVVFSLTGINDVILDFDDIFVGDSAQLGENLLITGGFLSCYDGLSVVESGFHIYPDKTNITATGVGSGGIINNNEYVSYIIVYEWTDAKGQVHRSAPSLPIQIKATTNSYSVDLTIPTLHITEKIGDRGDVKIAIYRTTASLIPTQIFYKLTTLTNTTSSLIVTYSDTTVTNAQLQVSEILYTTGGIVENVSPPAARLVARYKNRLVLAGLEETNTLYYSKAHYPGEAINFSDSFLIQVDDTGGAITSLGELDDKLIIFKRSTIFAMNGDGPLATGAQNTFSIPQLVSSDVGCLDPYSVVRTRVGLMFKSTKGIYLLDRSLQVQYIGADVERYNDLTITSAVVVDDQNQVRFTTAEGRCLVYDLYFQQWYTYTNIPAIDGAAWNNTFVFLKTNAEVLRETPNAYVDVDTPIISRYVLAFLQFGQVQGFQRIFKMNILGENRGTHGLKIELGYDFRDFYEERFLVEPDDVLVSGSWGSDSVWGEAGTLWGGNVDGVYQFQIRPRQQRCQALKLKVEDYFPNNTGSAGFAFSNVTAEIGVEPNIGRIAKTKIIAP